MAHNRVGYVVARMAHCLYLSRPLTDCFYVTLARRVLRASRPCQVDMDPWTIMYEIKPNENVKTQTSTSSKDIHIPTR